MPSVKQIGDSFKKTVGGKTVWMKKMDFGDGRPRDVVDRAKMPKKKLSAQTKALIRPIAKWQAKKHPEGREGYALWPVKGADGTIRYHEKNMRTHKVSTSPYK